LYIHISVYVHLLCLNHIYIYIIINLSIGIVMINLFRFWLFNLLPSIRVIVYMNCWLALLKHCQLNVCHFTKKGTRTIIIIWY